MFKIRIQRDIIIIPYALVYASDKLACCKRGFGTYILKSVRRRVRHAFNYTRKRSLPRRRQRRRKIPQRRARQRGSRKRPGKYDEITLSVLDRIQYHSPSVITVQLYLVVKPSFPISLIRMPFF